MYKPSADRTRPAVGRTQIEDLLLLQRVAQRIASILDLDGLLEQIVDDVATTFGYSRSAVLLVDENAGEVEIAAVRGWTSNYHVKGERFKISEGMIGRVVRTGRTRYAPDVAADPHYMVSEESTRSEVDIPIRSRGRLIGVFNAQHPKLDAFPPSRLRLLEALAGHVGVAIDNARLFERERLEKERMARELAEARTIQMRLFPERAPSIPGFRVSGLSQPCLSVGGDWYDYFPLRAGRVAVVLGDVAGKGTGAALLMASTRSILRMCAEQVDSPAALLTEVNRVLTADLPSAKFVTLVYAVLDPRHRTVTVGNAGHLPPVLVDRRGARPLDARLGMPLGFIEGSYGEYEVKLRESNRLVFYTDGVVEATNSASEEYGETRLLHHLKGPSASADSLLAEVLAYGEGRPAADDITIVIVDTG